MQARALKQKQDITQIIVPQRNAVPAMQQCDLMKQRNEDIAIIKKMGREEWKITSNYHQRSKAETFMYRYKVILGGHLQAREFSRQETEVKVGCIILNIMILASSSRLRRDDEARPSLKAKECFVRLKVGYHFFKRWSALDKIHLLSVCPKTPQENNIFLLS